ncbi:glycosyltransferase family 1 protein, partial [Candidatus Berkelbacteria bacterium]|nr:glycosyltransferase family 1 protein [Candidatus Berkelbacteria bacterium]
AMQASIPVVASAIPTTKEVAGAAVLYVEKETALEWAASISRLLHSPKLRLQLISKGKKRIFQYSWKAAAEKTLMVFDQVLKGK